MRFKVLCVGLFLAPLFAGAAPSQDVRQNDILSESKKLDRYLTGKWKTGRINPSDPSTDHEFVRRVHLDLIGRSATLEEVEEFVKDTDERKRFNLIDKLVVSDDFDRFWAEKFTNEYFGYSDGQWARRNWMWEYFYESVKGNKPYNVMVQELIGAQGNSRDNKATNFVLKWIDNDTRQEITNRVSKLFIGVKISCAACHDHPFAKWKREHFFSLSTFFYKSKYRQVGENDDKNKYWVIDDDYKNAKSESFVVKDFNRNVAPTFLNGLRPRTDNLRQELGNLLTNDPQFVRAAINRLWAHYFHRGIVDPPDDFSKRNEPSAPDLLNKLTVLFIQQKFSLRNMARIFTYTDAYQLSSVRPENDEKKATAAEAMFAVRPLRVINPSQIFDTFVRATKLDETNRYKDKRGDLLNLRRAFLEYVGPNYEDEFAPHGEMNFSMQQIIRMITWREIYLGLDERQADPAESPQTGASQVLRGFQNAFDDLADSGLAQHLGPEMLALFFAAYLDHGDPKVEQITIPRRQLEVLRELHQLSSALAKKTKP